MKDIYLLKYSVKGIKTLNQLVELNFYKKTITKDINTQPYNIKGIYGMNGSGKSGIIISVDILKNLIENMEYLNNPLVQKKLNEIINKKTGELFIETDFLVREKGKLYLFRYGIRLFKNTNGKYEIKEEELCFKNAVSKKEEMEPIFYVKEGEIDTIYSIKNKKFSDLIVDKTRNLLSTSSICAIFFGRLAKDMLNDEIRKESFLAFCLSALFVFGFDLNVYLDQSDEHQDYLMNNTSGHYTRLEKEKFLVNEWKRKLDVSFFNAVYDVENIIPKDELKNLRKSVKQLYEFLHVFKTDLLNIEIDKKELGDAYVCNLIMVYDSYKIDAEFESTGIKKLIKLFAYLKKMVNGGIVFIDEFDSNLHDVYLCALLEYLMEYGEGQLCFTTHNVGPMDILKKNKKSIDFLSIDHKIYPWKTNGHYSPSKLYRIGMIEGSPYNVDAIDFIGVFTDEEGN